MTIIPFDVPETKAFQPEVWRGRPRPRRLTLTVSMFTSLKSCVSGRLKSELTSKTEAAGGGPRHIGSRYLPTILLFNPAIALMTSPCSRAGTLNLFSVSVRALTDIVQSSSVIIRQVWAVSMSRPVYLQGPPVSTKRKSSTSCRTRTLESELKPTKKRPSLGSVARRPRKSSVTAARAS